MACVCCVVSCVVSCVISSSSRGTRAGGGRGLAGWDIRVGVAAYYETGISHRLSVVSTTRWKVREGGVALK
jgi:hypothetical protein